MTGYQRVLLKLSGEVFGGGKVGLDLDVDQRDRRARSPTSPRSGVQVAIVVGGGNFFRGAELQQRGMERARADYMGMLGTVMNCLALQDLIEKHGVETRVQTAITMGQVAEPYIPRRAIRHLEKGRVVIFGAGAGMPFFSTDTVAAQRALETRCEVDPDGQAGRRRRLRLRPEDRTPTRRKFDTLTYDEFLARGLKVADATVGQPGPRQRPRHDLLQPLRAGHHRPGGARVRRSVRRSRATEARRPPAAAAATHAPATPGDPVINDILNEADGKMDKSVEATREEFAAIRAGRAQPSMFSKIMVDYYGSPDARCSSSRRSPRRRPGSS